MHGSAEMPDVVWKIMEKPTFHDIGKSFEFLFSECGISIFFSAQNVDFSMEFIYSDLVYLEPFFSGKFAFSKCRISIFGVYTTGTVSF